MDKPYARQDRYDAANTRQIKFKFNLKTDADILAQLDAVPNKQGYIKKLIREDLNKTEAKRMKEQIGHMYYK